MANLAVIVVNYNTSQLLGEMFAALDRSAVGIDYQCVLIDNASRDDSVEAVRRDYPGCRLIANTVNVGFGRANNQGLPLIDAPYVLLLNTDAFVAADTLHKTLDYMKTHPRCGILGVKLLGRDGSLQSSCRYFPTPWNIFLQRTGIDRLFPGTQLIDDMEWGHDVPRSCDWVPGCYFLVRKEVITQIGLFDPRYFLYFEEVDHCFAARKAGWEVHFFPGTTVVHLGGESAKSDGEITVGGRQLEALQIESELLYFRKNLGASAVVKDVVLTSLADAILLCKRLIKGRRPFGANEYWRHTVLVWSTLLRTRLGAQATR